MDITVTHTTVTPVEKITLVLTPEEFHDIVVCVETARPSLHDTKRRSRPAMITYHLETVRRQILEAADKYGI